MLLNVMHNQRGSDVDDAALTVDANLANSGRSFSPPLAKLTTVKSVHPMIYTILGYSSELSTKQPRGLAGLKYVTFPQPANVERALMRNLPE